MQHCVVAVIYPTTFGSTIKLIYGLKEFHMEKKKELFLAMALFASAFTAYAFADTTQDSKLISSTQSYQLVPGTPTYNAWAHWISDKLNSDPNMANFSNGAPIQKHFAVPTTDEITIKVIVPPSADRFSTITPDSTPPAGPPTPLPAHGTPGERITITDATHTYYASWTYEWESTSDGMGGWNMIGSQYHDCGENTDKPESVACQPM
jgi:hypothetical protein